ncbi:hypothetical protein [Rubrimonas sp.]|uniref:hypothetical protein n=1 Tax=Rubrimonas sp. TaxID=2036015 RepID=UPI002FDE050D
MTARRGTAAALAALAALALAAPGAQAQQSVRVRAGEHPDYTRLVIDAAPGAPFEWGVAGDALVVLMPQAGGFDLGVAQRAAGLSRVAGFAGASAPAGAVLTVRLRCECGARETRMADGRVVLDISANGAKPPAPRIAAAEAEAAEPAPTRSAQAAAPAAAPSATARAPRARPAPASPARAAAPPSPASSVAPATPAPEAQVAPELPPLALAEAVQAAPESALEPAQTAEERPDAPLKLEDVAGETAPTDDAIEQARQALLKQLTRAAEQGLLTLRETPEAPPETTGESAAEEGDAVSKVPSETALAETQLRARSAIDIAAERGRGSPGAAKPETPAHCLADAAFDVERWASDAAFDLQVGEGRRALIGEFDAPNAGAVLGYAKLLIRYGFGVEARAALTAFSAHVAPPPQLMEMAALIDGDAPPSAGELAQGADCPGLHGLWGASARALGGTLDVAALDVVALRAAIAETPPNLRAALALPVAQAALDAGEVDLAEAVVGVVARSEPEPPEGDAMVAVLLARIDFARGDHRRAEAMLLPLIAHNTPAGVEAMIRLAEMRVARGVASPPGLAEDMEAVAFSQRDSLLGRRLLAAAAGARAASEGLAPALGALRRLSDRAGDRARAEIAARDMLVDYKPDPTEAGAYAETALTHWDMVGDGPEGDRARVAVARNLAAMELGNLAEDLLRPALARGDAAARIAAGAAALAAGAPERALEHLGDMAAPEAGRLRAEAFAAQFLYDEAVAAAAASGDAALEARYAWLAGNWERAAKTGDVDRRLLAAWMAGEGDLPEDLRAAAQADPEFAARAEAFAPGATEAPSDTLQALNEALEQARRRRELMGSLLGDG